MVFSFVLDRDEFRYFRSAVGTHSLEGTASVLENLIFDNGKEFACPAAQAVAFRPCFGDEKVDLLLHPVPEWCHSFPPYDGGEMDTSTLSSLVNDL